MIIMTFDMYYRPDFQTSHYFNFSLCITRQEDFDSEVLKILVVGNTGGNDVRQFIGKSSVPMDGSKSSSHFTGLLCFLVLAFTVFWLRRRRYDMRGMHKKNETYFP